MVAWRRQLNTAAYTCRRHRAALLMVSQHESSLSHPCSDSYPYLLKSSFLSPSLTDEWQVQDCYLTDLPLSALSQKTLES